MSSQMFKLNNTNYLFSFILFIAFKGIIGGVIPNASSLQNVPLSMHSNTSRIVPRIPMKVQASSSSSNNHPSNLAIQHRPNPKVVISSKNELVNQEHPAQVEKHFSEEKLTENKIMEALLRAINNVNQETDEKYNKHIEELANMIKNDVTTLTNFGINKNFEKQILELGSKTIINLTEYDDIMENHRELFEKGIELATTEDKLKKFKMAGNRITDKEIETNLKTTMFNKTSEETLIKQILNVFGIKELKPSLFGKIHIKQMNINNSINFLNSLFPNEYDVVGDSNTKEERLIKLKMIEKLEMMIEFFESIKKILGVIKY